MSEPRDHHYVPQFFLRNFATDAEKRKVTTVAKNGNFAIWAERSIEHLGFERDLYVHLRAGVPVSVESAINSRIETPISQSDTWTKIASGRTDALDRSDKPILYALIRRNFLQEWVESIAWEGMDHEAKSVHGRADHWDPAGAGGWCGDC